MSTQTFANDTALASQDFSLDLTSITGCTVYDAQGEKIGTAATVFLDDQSGKPEWVTITTGFLGRKEHFAPLAGATQTAEGLTLTCTKDQVTDAPTIDGDQRLTSQQESELYNYYGAGIDTYPTDPTASSSSADAANSGYDAVKPATGSAISADQATGDATAQEDAKARLRKYVAEDSSPLTPASHEGVLIGRDPAAKGGLDTDVAPDRGQIDEPFQEKQAGAVASSLQGAASPSTASKDASWTSPSTGTASR